MQENQTYTQDSGRPVQKKMNLREWLDNFWYHYKWHSLVALFLVFAITVCSLQMCQKTSYDVHVMYAGSYEIERTSESGTPEYEAFISSLSRVSDDFDESGHVTVNLRDLFLLSSKEIEEVEKDKEHEVNYVLINQNIQIFKDNMAMSDYYVCFISKALYDEYKLYGNETMFAPLAPYVSKDTKIEYYDTGAVLLSSTGFSTLPGIRNLPDDTVVCLRRVSAVAEHLNKKQTAEQFARAEKVIEKILNYKPIV